ncbi:orotidine-5'-phosphate decarboxylase [Candidatus Aerophobetes bacterium]|uniref:Orotidine 5'-phosphate decarboxylase n=1 Tax=Aerophobetes bacterium TaxID=2030807 RepID=A0A523QKX5_UNCAE|nr:MAG: orotidine-5'-phosphate decarboxylase [Candidatus Aerophobetes bacterium]
MQGSGRERLILALDVDTKEEAELLARELKDLVRMFKVGPRLFTRYGPKIIEAIRKQGIGVFYDAKFHDIPSVVAKATEAAVRMGVNMLTVHTLGGLAMMEAAVEAMKGKAEDTKIVGVTILTSLDSSTLKEELGVGKDLSQEVVHLAKLAKKAGLDGVVSSPKELVVLRRAFSKDFLLVVPGIRPKGVASNEQHRFLSPGEAVRRGADFVVVGRPILAAEDPLESTKNILREIEGYL